MSGRGPRFPEWVFGRGAEPDPRFTLANERTFLAWIRTSLALIAGGVALAALRLPLQPVLHDLAAAALLLLGLLIPVLAWFVWARTERALRIGSPLPSTAIVSLPLAAGVLVVGALVVVGSLLR